MTQYAISWDFQQSFCSGLSSFQQNGDFVDMTLAADGHLVKVHQLVMAMASPYIKELIASAQCPHPVIFLNKISYKILSALLEYIYTGQVQVSVEYLNDLIDAGKELHIRGIENVKIDNSSSSQYQKTNVPDEVYFQVESIPQTSMHEDTLKSPLVSRSTQQRISQENYTNTTSSLEAIGTAQETSAKPMQYTVSNQGSIQMILNRFIYYLKYTTRNQTRRWRCVDYVTKSKCPAYVVTKDNMVMKRVGVHKHTFHDKRILKKLRVGFIFSDVCDAEIERNKAGQKTSKQTKPETELEIENEECVEKEDGIVEIEVKDQMSDSLNYE